jgi:integrase
MARDGNTRLRVAIEDFSIVRAARLSPHTLHGYLKTLRELCRIMGDPRIKDLTVQTVAPVISDKRKTSPSAARLMAATIKAFASWLATAGYVSDQGRSVLEQLGTPKFNGRREAFSDADFDKIRKALNALEAKSRLRSRALILLMMGSGLRANEARLLQNENVHIERPIDLSWALVTWDTSKGAESRRVRIDPQAASAIHQYRSSERREIDGALFLTEEGKPFTYSGMQSYAARLTDHMEKHGVQNFMFHRLRHQWATMSARTGATEWELAAEGGWQRGSKVPAHYVDGVRFEDLLRKPTALSLLTKRVA